MSIRGSRAATREALPMDNIKFARAKGLSEKRVLGDGVCRRDGNGVFGAWDGQAADRFHHQPGSSGGGRVSAADRGLPGHVESGGGHHLHGAGPPRAFG
ncbi:hypothetical protein G6F50_018185 [Rhizopus delemar]|uniref:Uncharacterized protein n=1 Tax=Rhizopus delemar TaxID=936053 RepID=A0A9P6XN34_9FUNG|nr:hypothetical protein G6F50_018185 [Rhizopus delemar]